MVTVTYDGSFEGLLTAIFDVYEYKFSNATIVEKQNAQANVFGNFHHCINDSNKAKRVWKGLGANISTGALTQLYKTFLSGLPGIENTILQYVQYVFASKLSVEYNYADDAVLKIKNTARKVDREKHRMEAFIRFQLTKDGLYYAMCQPDYNVLPLIENHFKKRYADQRWLIYDSTRKYGLYYDMITVENVQLTFNADNHMGKNITAIADAEEELYKQLWQQYFNSVNIAARKNTKLHIQHMPRRYWKYLTEKQVPR